MIQVDLSGVYPFVSREELEALTPRLAKADQTLRDGTGQGADFLGWLTLPGQIDAEEYDRVKKAASRVRENSDVLVVVGIGGSYLGARAVLECIQGPFHNDLSRGCVQAASAGGKRPEIYFAGCNASPSYLRDVISLIGERDFSINVISKSGTTTEPALAFRVLKALAERRYGKQGAKERILATTDKTKGVLKTLADKEGYETFVVPDDIGGRFSVLTSVGLLPLAAAGVDTDALLAGAREMMTACADQKNLDNPAWRYAAARYALMQKGKSIELLACYEPAFRFMAEWWKQLYGESEGKDGKGLFPASVELTADLHSMGQYIQDGQRILLETVVAFGSSPAALPTPLLEGDPDGLNFLAGMDLFEINERARKGTYLAHLDGGVPNLVITGDAMDARTMGQMVYFFELAVGLSGYLLAVNPFDQPGVEEYKKNMFALLGKPGYEQRRAQLLSRLQS